MALPEPSDSSAALVTGASSGIGESIARRLAERDYNLVLAARREDRLRELASELAGAHGIRAETVAVDLETQAARDELIARVEALGLDIEILVNNAGFGGAGNVHDMDRERQLTMVRLNCEALLDLQARYSGPMAHRGRGAIINVASTASFQPIPGTATYAATKAFVLSLSEASHSELAGRGVTVTALCPGPVKTEFTEAAGISQAEEKLPQFFWTDVDDVAREAVEGADKGRRVVVPGIMNRAGALAGQHTPRALILPIAKRAWRQAL